jgi:hypothetical protein
MGFDISNTGSKGDIFSIADDDLTSQPDESSLTIVPGDTNAVEESVRDFGVGTQQPVQAPEDFSLLDGVNPDSVLAWGGSLDSLSPDLQNYLGNGLSVDDMSNLFSLNGLYGNPPIEIDTDVQPKLRPVDNVLHNYASHTYRITLGAQSLADHQVTSEGNGLPTITTMMMASGGGRAVDNVKRDPIFDGDFYIEDLQLTSVIGSNAQGNGSNTVNLTFTIIEPYSVSLIERLLALANKLDYGNYIEIPYVFKIEFVGYDDDGNEIGVVPQTTKYIPFKLTYMNFVVKESGAGYQCTGVPTNHFAFNETIARLPEPVTVAAGTIEEFFNGKNTGENQNNTTGGFVQTVNEFHKKLTRTTGQDSKKKPLRTIPDEIEVWIHPSIGKGKLTTANLANVAMLKEATGPGGRMDPQKPVHGFKTGTSITAAIRDIIKNSTFITDQLSEAARIKASNEAEEFSRREGRAGARETPIPTKPFINFRIVSKYRMGDYDPAAGRHAYKVRFEVIPSDVRATRFNEMGKIDIKSVAKEYNYLFTGDNQDILSLDLKFDLAFYHSRNANTESVTQTTQATNDKRVKGDDEGDSDVNRGDPINNAPTENHHVSARDNVGQSTKESKKKVKSDAFWRSIMQESRGDMVTFDMEILGDPAFIKQDDILWKSDDPIDGPNPFTPNGSIKQDIRLTFNVHDDINHENGLRYEGRNIPNSTFNSKSVFNGYYKVLQLDSTFRDGQFTQNLVVARSPVQSVEEDLKSQNETQSSGIATFNLLDNGVDAWNQEFDLSLRPDQSVREEQTGGFAVDGVAVSETDFFSDTPTSSLVNADTIVDFSIAQTNNADRD